MAYTTHGAPTRHPTTTDTNHPGSSGITNHASGITNYPNSSGGGVPANAWLNESAVAWTNESAAYWTDS